MKACGWGVEMVGNGERRLALAASGLERGTHWYYERARGSYSDDKAGQGGATQRRKWETENPKTQKFAKTDLAEFEHAWLGLPHFVCLGAEKNFNKLAERMAEDGEPVVDQNYFKHAVAKAILWRTAEKLFDTLELDGYRANSVAFAVAWLAEQSERRINLDWIWENQRISPALNDVLKAVCAAAHQHITRQDGNPGEVSKREACWTEFLEKKISEPKDWRDELSDTAFVAAKTEDESLAAEWERVRREFIEDARTVGELEALTGKSWMASRRREPVYFYAEKNWDKLRGMRNMGIKKIRGLVELFSAASRR